MWRADSRHRLPCGLGLKFQTHMTIGRASETESEYFIGEITGVQVFDYVLSPEQVKAITHTAPAGAHAGEAGPKRAKAN